MISLAKIAGIWKSSPWGFKHAHECHIMTFWRERVCFLESKQPHKQGNQTKRIYLDHKVKHLEDERHQYLIDFGLWVHGFQALIMGQHSVTKSQALLLIGFLCHLLHSMVILVWKWSKIMEWKGSSFGNQASYLGRKLLCTHYS